MAKLINRGFTNYFGDTPTPIEILSYDNNKYVKVRLPSGEETEIKRGYIYRDEKLTRRIPAINWHILGGGKRMNYRPRKSLTRWDVQVNGKRIKFATKREAVEFTMPHAKALGENLEIWSVVERNHFWGMGDIVITCTPNGHAYQHQQRNRIQKYMRGYGKVHGPLPKIKGETF